MGFMSSLELTLTWLARIRPYWARTSSEASWRRRSNVFDCCCQGQVGFSGEESVNVEDGGEDDEQEGGAKGFPSSEDSLDAEGCVPGAQAIEGGEQ